MTTIGIVITDHIVAGRLEDQRLTGKPLRFPFRPREQDALSALPPSETRRDARQSDAFLQKGATKPLSAIGVAVPGIVRHGVLEDSPNLTQLKGLRLADDLTRALARTPSPRLSTSPTTLTPSPAGVAAPTDALRNFTRVWTIGNGIGYGPAALR